MVHPVAPTMWMDWYRAMLGLKGGDERGKKMREGRGEREGERSWEKRGGHACHGTGRAAVDADWPRMAAAKMRDLLVASERRKVGPGQLTW